MNQQFKDSSDREFEDLEAKLSAMSLTPPSDDYQNLANTLPGTISDKSSNNWLVWALAATAIIAVTVGLSEDFLRSDSATSTNQAEIAQQAAPPVAPIENQASLPSYIEGIHFARLFDPVDVSNNGTNDVVAFFWYSCDPCNQFEPFLGSWENDLPSDVSLTRVPAIWSEEMRFHARAYYTAQALGVSERSHGEFYAAFHRENAAINNEEQLINFFTRFGVTPAEFDSAYAAPETLAAVAQAEQLNAEYGIQATPSLFIGGQFGVIPAAVDFGEWLEVTDYLLEAFCDPEQATAFTTQAC